MIEFFSPYCSHCRHFKPTWAELVETKSTAALGFSMAQVDCIASCLTHTLASDLCQEQKVPHYPYITLYSAGKQIDIYQGDRSFAHLSQYIDESIKQHLPSPDTLPEATPEVETEPSQSRLGARSYNLAGELLVLNSVEQFDAAVAEGPLFVKMYAPWCGHCKKLAPIWKKLASSMQGLVNIAEVDCEANGALCRREKVEGYPVMYFYQNGRRTDYRGPRKLPELEEYTKRPSRGLQPLNVNELDEVIRSEPAFFLYLHDPASSTETDLVRKTAIEHAGGIPVYSSSSHALFEEFSISSKEPVLISIKDHVREPASFFFLAGVVESDISAHKQDLERFLMSHRFPSAFELTSTNFQEVMRGGFFDTVVVAPTSQSSQPGPSEVESVLATARKAWADRVLEPNAKTTPALFVWMDMEKWGEWLLKMYGFKAADAGTRVVLADHKRFLYYDGDDGKPIGLTSGEIVSALSTWKNGAVLKHSEYHSISSLLFS
ncbi:thioredoxin-domain-containing protein [Clavulina sp. PMI_390]|nr:thioredoxin-domain-containing protein [Clavulina sp. PMI_390]